MFKFQTKGVLIILILLLASTAWGVSLIGSGIVEDGFCSGTSLFCEDFEDNESCSTAGWTNIYYSPDCQATDQTINTYSLKLDHTGVGTVQLDNTYTAQNPVFLKFSFRVSSTAGENYIFFVKTITSTRADLRISAGELYGRWGGTEYINTSVSISADTWYTVKIKVSKDSGGSDGYMYIWAASGANQTLSTNTGDADGSATGLSGNYTIDADGLRFTNDESGITLWIDNVIVSATDPDL
ncbi:MAG: hypothetical protein JJW03_05270 [Desulfosarcina sp.]|nr:hypothetical protein [Desulfobacterales bacterium]